MRSKRLFLALNASTAPIASRMTPVIVLDEIIRNIVADRISNISAAPDAKASLSADAHLPHAHGHAPVPPPWRRGLR